MQVEHRRLEAEVGAPLYFPFELRGRRPTRAIQGYLFKLPAFFVDAFPALMRRTTTITAPQAPRDSPSEIGGPYRPANVEASVAQRDPFEVDPALVERALRGHAATQNDLAAYVRGRGFEPRSPTSSDPGFDLAWRAGSTTFVAEVKSTTGLNEERQLRLGLGQVLRYQQLLQGRGPVRAVLAVERTPADEAWLGLCSHLGVTLAWPGAWERISLPEMRPGIAEGSALCPTP